MEEKMNSFISKDELSRLTEAEITVLRRNIESGSVINRKFSRSQYYPFL